MRMMMSCKEASRLISAGLDRDLNLTRRAGLRLHLMMCSACSRAKAQLAFLHRMAPGYPGGEDDGTPGG